jgi:hypothetical protein
VIPIYNTHLWKAVIFIAGKIGEARDTTYFPKTRALIEGKAIAGELDIWGRKQLDADPQWVDTRKFANRHTPIPPAYWTSSKLMPYCTVEPAMQDKDHNWHAVLDVPCTKEAEKGSWQNARNSYADLQVNWSQFEGLWEAPAQFSEEQNKLNANIFNRGLTAWREWLAGLQEMLCNDFVTVALANREALARDPIDWVTENVKNFWAPRRKGFQNWVKVCCDQSDADNWLAPLWLLKQIPDEVLKNTPYPLELTPDGRVLAPYTDGILVWIENLISVRLDMSKNRVLDEAKIKIASEPAPTFGTQSAPLIGKVQGAADAIGRKYEYKWDKKWWESTRELYAELHPTRAKHAGDKSLNSTHSRETLGRRERGPDNTKHQVRVELENCLISELAAVRECLGESVFTLDELRKRFPDFKLWPLLSETEQDELLEKEFKPKVYARALTARKFGVGAETIKKSRQKLKLETPSA